MARAPAALARAPVRPTVLLATDGLASSTAAVRHAVTLARQLGARLVAATIIDQSGFTLPGAHPRVDQIRDQRTAIARVIVAEAMAGGVPEASFLVWVGSPGDAIVEAAIAESATLIVVGCRGRNAAERLLLGSVSDHLVRHAPCPVVVVRAGLE